MTIELHRSQRRQFHPAIHEQGEQDVPAILHALGSTVRFNRAEVIFSEGDQAGSTYRILSGAVGLCKIMADGRRQIVQLLLPGDFMGVKWDDECALTAEALSDVVAIRYCCARLRRLGDERSDVGRHLVSILRQDMCRAQQHVALLGRQTARERVASFLVALADRSDGNHVDLPLGRQDIGDYLGLTIETVCRALSELRRARIIAIPNRSHVTIRDPATLQAIAQGESDLVH